MSHQDNPLKHAIETAPLPVTPVSELATITRVPFHGDEITCVEVPDGVFVPIRPICTRLGVDFSAQYRRVNRSPELFGVAVMATEQASGDREMVCIRLTRVAYWLATINVSRVKPELRQAVEWYQTEAAEALDRHFRLKEAVKDARIEELERMLWHAHQQLRIDSPKWARVYAMMEVGESDYMIAQRCNWSMDREHSELAAMRRCGMSPTWRQDMATLESKNSQLRWELERSRQQADLFEEG